jgi:UDP-sugar pyrophosphorylase
MVSNDTKHPTMKLLKDNKCFGLKRRQIYIVQQGDGVPALIDNDAHFAMDDEGFKVVTKPHGHGDIHSLLYKEGVTKEWQDKLGIEYIVFFQDTNGLAFHTLPLMLGVSVQCNFIMNSLCVPRKAKQAIGGIARLTNSKTGQERCVEKKEKMTSGQDVNWCKDDKIHHITSEGLYIFSMNDDFI